MTKLENYVVNKLKYYVLPKIVNRIKKNEGLER